ncbi:MAG: lipase maturation factor family protein [bacterium]
MIKPLRALWRHLWDTETYWLTRFFLLRMLGLIYTIAFLIIVFQGEALLGSEGLTPADQYLQAYRSNHDTLWRALVQKPSVFVLYYSDSFFQGTALTGLLLSNIVLAGFSNSLMLGVLWLQYLSFVHIGQIWYGYGWEMQLLETGFLGIFLAAPLDPRPFSRHPPTAVIWLFRWLTFRLMLGSGLIKLRGDSCWWDLTCLYYHYETQPLPNTFSWYFHHLPGVVHQAGVLFNHFVEVICPFGVFGPQLIRYLAGSFMGLFQVILIASGNLSFLNWLTLIAVLACFDDNAFRTVLPEKIVQPLESLKTSSTTVSLAHKIKIGLLVALIGWLSINPIKNLIRDRQLMNAGFEPFRIVNTYGAFGSIGKTRRELVIQGTRDRNPDLMTDWKEYDFKAKPGPVSETPPWLSPYHYRLDWQIWFAAMSSPRRHPWVLNLVWKLLNNDRKTLGLLETNPFPDNPPRYIKIDRYRYEFTKPGSRSGHTWKRTVDSNWLPPLSRENSKFRAILKRRGWL